MSDLKKIALTTDFSANADAATAYAVKLAKAFEGRIALIHVFDDSFVYNTMLVGGGMYESPTKWIEASKVHLKKQLDEKAAELASKERVPVESVLLEGNITEEILEYLKEHKMECLVTATHGRTGLAHVILGSIAERLVRASPCPTLTVRPAQIVAAKP
ncbi:MAG: universal stress protein [Planctomycetes bacterium]|nr:universal stress protein [Planctomycetota bacterium]